VNGAAFGLGAPSWPSMPLAGMQHVGMDVSTLSYGLRPIPA
jgi:hypothetical protein